MAVPKKRTSVSRKGLRRAGQHHKMYRKFPMACPNCGSDVLPLHICPACGVYKGKEIIVMAAAHDAQEENSGESQPEA